MVSSPDVTTSLTGVKSEIRHINFSETLDRMHRTEHSNTGQKERQKARQCAAYSKLSSEILNLGYSVVRAISKCMR